MEAKFTKGPWVTDGFTVFTTGPKEGDDRTFGYGCGNNFVCCLNDSEYHEYVSRDEQEANAHLIAAAPELYDIVEEFLRLDMFLNSPARKRAVEVLAKARGES